MSEELNKWKHSGLRPMAFFGKSKSGEEEKRETGQKEAAWNMRSAAMADIVIISLLLIGLCNDPMASSWNIWD